MITFFRRIRQNLLSQGKIEKYLNYTIGEIIRVVIGSLIAMFINNQKNKQRYNFAVLTILLFCITGCHLNDNKQRKIHLEELTIAEIHKAYKEGTYNSQDLVKAYIASIEENDDIINAITIINPEAISIAEVLDEDYQKTKVLRPLHGIPIIVKDNINTKGLPTTAGALALQDFIPKENAFVIEKLVKAGAIILGKSNMAEWAFSPMHTESSTGGITRNPYNTDYVPAGSSGGTAAAIASNFALGGLGTDTGNSIRGPSSHNALVGFRTTLGLISREGIVPLFLRNDVVGPMCRTVEDATRIMEVMAGIDPKDSITKNALGKTPRNYNQYLIKDGLKGSRIGVLREIGGHKIDPEIKTLFENAISNLDVSGAKIIDSVEIPNFTALSQNQWCASFRSDLEAFLADYVKRDTLSTLEDIIRIGTNSEYSKAQLSTSTTQSGRWGDSDVECLDVYHDEKRIAFREAIEATMDSLKLDALIYPSWNNKPARIDRFMEDYKGDNSQVIAPHTGQPAFTVPMGYTSNNLPVGIQFLGRMYAESTLIRITYSYEQESKLRKPPILKQKTLTKDKMH